MGIFSELVLLRLQFGMIEYLGELFKGLFNIVESLLDGLFTGFKQIFDRNNNDSKR